MTYSFCTYFDYGYLSCGLALYQSLRRQCVSFQLWILCLDRQCYETLARLDLRDVYLLPLEDLEKDDETLLVAKQNRSPVEYYFTCTPSLILYIFRHHRDVELLTYLDADIFFFADPAPIFLEISTHSIAIIEHRFPQALKHLERYGIYNVGWVSFRRDEQGLTCLAEWRRQCLQWCYDRLADGRFADQKYLDDWPTRYSNLVVLRHKGANLAPWNVANYQISRDEQGVWVDRDHLIFFHFHRLRVVKNWLYDPGLTIYKAKCTPIIKHAIYAPYIRLIHEIAQRFPSPSRLKDRGRQDALSQTRWHRIVFALKRIVRLWFDFLSRQLIVFVDGQVI